MDSRRINPFKCHLTQIQPVNKQVDHTNRIVFADPVFNAFRKQRALTTIDPLDEALHLSPRKSRESYPENQLQQRVFTQPGSAPDTESAPANVRSPQKRRAIS